MNNIIKDLIEGFKKLNITGILFIFFMFMLFIIYIIGSYEAYENSKIAEALWHLIGVVLPIYVIYRVLIKASKY